MVNGQSICRTVEKIKQLIDKREYAKNTNKTKSINIAKCIRADPVSRKTKSSTCRWYDVIEIDAVDHFCFCFCFYLSRPSHVVMTIFISRPTGDRIAVIYYFIHARNTNRIFDI